jgi:hypothetical protein
MAAHRAWSVEGACLFKSLVFTRCVVGSLQSLVCTSVGSRALSAQSVRLAAYRAWSEQCAWTQMWPGLYKALSVQEPGLNKVRGHKCGLVCTRPCQYKGCGLTCAHVRRNSWNSMARLIWMCVIYLYFIYILVSYIYCAGQLPYLPYNCDFLYRL